MAKQLPKRELENVGLGVTGACVALVTLVVAALIFMVAQKGLSAFFKDGVSIIEFLSVPSGTWPTRPKTACPTLAPCP